MCKWSVTVGLRTHQQATSKDQSIHKPFTVATKSPITAKLSVRHRCIGWDYTSMDNVVCMCVFPGKREREDGGRTIYLAFI